MTDGSHETILAAQIFTPQQLSRIYGVMFVDASSEQSWADLVAFRNHEYQRYLTPPTTATGTAQWDRSIRTGQMANTVERLNNTWHKQITNYVKAAVAAGIAVSASTSTQEKTNE